MFENSFFLNGVFLFLTKYEFFSESKETKSDGINW